MMRVHRRVIGIFYFCIRVLVIIGLVGSFVHLPAVSAGPAGALNKSKNNTTTVRRANRFEFTLGTGDRAVFGGENTPSAPEVTLYRWGDEAFLRLRLGDDLLSPVRENSVEFDNLRKRARWLARDAHGNSLFEVDFYPLEPENVTLTVDNKNYTFLQREHGGVEFDVILSKVPPTNVFAFPLDTKNLDFCYQPPLHPDHPTWADEDNDGVADAFRPPNVVGSYAVYHKSKVNNEYGTGKAFHIYRPKIIDNSGDWIWGELDVDENRGILTVTVDRNWLDNADYPVVIDPLFGYEGAGASSTLLCYKWMNTNTYAIIYYCYLDGSYFSLNENEIIPNSIWFYISQAPYGANVKTAIYDYNSDALLATSASAYVSKSSTGWRGRAISNAPELSSGKYWLVALGDGSSIYDPDPYDTCHYGPLIAYDTGSTGQGVITSPGSYSFPSKLGGGHYARKYSIYCISTYIDTDGDGLTDLEEMNKYETCPLNPDTDGDGLSDGKEVNVYKTNPKQPDLFVEIDYLTGYKPSQAALDYLVQYYNSLGVHVHIDNDENANTNPASGYEVTEVTYENFQMAGVEFPEWCLIDSDLVKIEMYFHDYPGTHVYIFYGTSCNVNHIYYGEARGEFGGVVFKQSIEVKASENADLDAENMEKVALLHELGHCINIIRWENDPNDPDGPRDANRDGDGYGIEDYHELYCDYDDPGQDFGHDNCIMAYMTTQNAVANPKYCTAHWALRYLKDKWSVDGEWGLPGSMEGICDKFV